MKTIFKTNLNISFPVVEKLENEIEMLQKDEFKLENVLFNFKLENKQVSLKINQSIYMFKIKKEFES